MISVVVLTKNEEKNIRDCLESLKFCDEIIVVDDKSSDSTREVAKKLGAKVFVHDMDKDYSEQSNFGMQKSKGEWILFVDADERVSEALRAELSIVNDQVSNSYYGFYLKRIDYMWGKWLRRGESGSFRSLRLVKKGSGKWTRRVHPNFVIEGMTSELKNPLLHYPHPTLREFLESVNRWSSWHALANKEEGKSSSLAKIIFWPGAHFIKNFILRGGFLDGMQGFVFAAVMSIHSFLSWGKLWFLQKGYTKI